ncbi:MAG: Leucine-, isoleucine-, valine-, threonine-, and alanine-binding protein precursor [Bacteroidetes bacterium ADurb.Bin174]|nr:MAG: Leucine-, isoleucine-, valine-, threonine-, and alanine-binding protein precursor [Bacteroidetes bacterium ADurb.Bin174]
MKKKTWFITVTIIAIIALLVLYFINQEKSKTVNIGIVLPLTENVASQGNDVLNGMKMAYADFLEVEKNNLLEFKFIIEDNFSTPKGSRTALEKIIQVSKPMIVLGPITTTDMLSMIPVAESTKTILFSPSASSPKLSNSGKYIFRMGPVAPDQAKVMSNYAYNDLSIKQIGVLYMNDDSGKSHKEAFEKEYKTLGGEIVFEESFDRKDVDFKALILKIKAAKLSSIYIAGTPKTTGHILKEARESNLDVKFISSTGAEGDDLLEIAQNAAEGIVYTSIFVDSTFIAKYKEKHQQNPRIGVVLGYDAMAITLKLLKENPNDKEKLKEALSKLDYQGVSGKTKMLPSGDAFKDIALKTVANGEFVFIK